MKKVIFTQGGKGGVGKTSFAATLLECLAEKGLGVKALDFDVENEKGSGLKHFVPEAEKFDISKEGAMDVILDYIDDEDVDIVLIDQQAAAGKATFAWFESMGDMLKEDGVEFISVGMITEDPGSVESVVTWSQELGDSCKYLFVKNEMSSKDADFAYFEESKGIKVVKKHCETAEMVFQHRMPEIEEALRVSGNTPYSVERGEGEVYLAQKKVVFRCRSYVKHFENEFKKIAQFIGVTEDV